MSTDNNGISFPQANITAVRGIAGALATTLGPRSNDKFVGNQIAAQNDPDPEQVAHNDYVVTSDGASILERLPLEHPIAPVVRRIAGPERPGETSIEGSVVPDGVTSTLILAASLLDEAAELLDTGVHPTDVHKGYVRALSVAEQSLDDARRLPEEFSDPQTLARNVAKTVMTGNDVGGRRDEWASYAVDAVDVVGYPGAHELAVTQVKAGSIADSRLVRGTALTRNEVARDDMPTDVEDATVLVIGGYKRNDVGDGRSGGLMDPDLQTEATIHLDGSTDVQSFEDVYAARRHEIVDRLVDLGVDVVVTRLGISSEYLDLLAANDIMGIRGVNRENLTRLARATGGTIVKDPTDIAPADLGHAGTVTQLMVEKRRNRRKRRRIVVVDDCAQPESVTALLCGSWGDIAAEATREFRKAARAVATARGEGASPAGVVPGGGAVDAGIARDVRTAAPARASREQLAMDAFADAVERVPFGLAKNSGLDPLSTVADIRAGADAGGYDMGLVLPDGRVGDVTAAGVLDTYATKLQGYRTAVEIAGLVLRIDDALDATFTKEPAGKDDVIYDERAETHEEYLDDTDGTIWD